MQRHLLHPTGEGDSQAGAVPASRSTAGPRSMIRCCSTGSLAAKPDIAMAASATVSVFLYVVV